MHSGNVVERMRTANRCPTTSILVLSWKTGIYRKYFTQPLGYFSRNYLGFYSYLYYIDQDHYSVFLHTVSMDTVLSPDEQLLSFDALLEILTKRIRDGKLQKILEINLGYLPKNIKNGDQNDASSWLLIPVWQIRGYDTYLDPVLDGTLSVLSEEDRIQYDPDMICSIYINAITGEIEPTVSF